MNIYICPYCLPSAKSRLYIAKKMDIPCDCKKTLFTKKKDCEKIDYKCKEVMQCKKCKEIFKITEDFLKKQKRKIKDG